MTRTLLVGLRRNLYLVLAFLVPTATFSAVLAGRGIYPFDPHGAYTTFMSDMNNQYAQFYSYFSQALDGHGSLLFTWRADGGMNFWPIVSYYLTSPFGLLTAFGSDRRLPMMIALITVLKLGAAGLGMALFLRKFRGDRDGAVDKAMIVVLSTAYALGAWSVIYAFNIMWLDALYLLPWVLLGIERLLATGRIAALGLAIGLNLIIDFYTGAMILVFASLYGLARYFGVRELFERKDFLRTVGRFALAGVLGGLLSAVFILPTYLGGLKQKTQLHSESLAGPPTPVLSMLIRFFGGTYDAASKSPNVGAATLILVLVPLFFVVPAIRRAERIAFGAVLAFLLIAMEVKPLYVLMHGGQMPNAFPYRFAFLIVALLTVMAFRAWVAVDSVKQIKWLGISAAFWFVVLYWGRQSYPRVVTPDVVRFDTVILVFGSLFLAFALYLRVRPAGDPLPQRLAWIPKRLATPQVAAVAAIAVLALDAVGSAQLLGQRYLGKQKGSGNGTVTRTNWYSAPSTSYGTALASLQPASDEFYRAEGFDQNLRSTNDSLRYGNFAFTHFSSLSSGKLHQTMEDLGFAHHEANVWSAHTGATLLTDALLGYQYLVGTTRESADGTIDRLGTTLQKTYDDTKHGAKDAVPDVTTVYKIDDTLPVGFRLTGDDLADFGRPLPQNAPFAAQEQLFGMPGAFQSLCGAPTVTGDGLTVATGTDGTVTITLPKTARAGSTSGKIVWNCQSSGARQVYLYAPGAFNLGQTFTRLDGQDRPAPVPGVDPGKDKANIQYPQGFSTGFQDLGSVQAGAFTVSMSSSTLTPGHTYRVGPDVVRGLDPAAVGNRIAQLRAGGVGDVHWTDTGLAATTTGDSAATVFFSVPSIPGWTVTVDGKTVKTTELLGAFTGVPVPAGTHRISFSFVPPGLYAGVGGSGIGLLALGGVWWFERRRAAAGGKGDAESGTAGSASVPEDVLS
ncbi:YfhO family protein [Catenulispora yoronensis]|uniref:YfhO family protein n=1 Tax=Catenulispora yoronensis TaxID=450799 RepID=A0ABN2TUH9_9ACTN